MATANGRRDHAEVFLVHRYRTVDPGGQHRSECWTSELLSLSDAIDLCHDWICIFEDCMPGCEVWLGNHCVFVNGEQESCAPVHGMGPCGPIAPGRYRWDSEAESWRLLGAL
jgi:hypothetical protein